MRMTMPMLMKTAVCAFACAAVLGEARAICGYDTAGGTTSIDSDYYYDGTDRFIIFQGTVNLNEGAYIKLGGDSGGACNFIGVDRSSSGVLNINGGTFWCSTDNGAGVLGVGNNNNGVTSTLNLNSGLLRVDTQLRSSTLWSDLTGCKSSGTVNINGGTAIVKQYCIGASSSNTGTSTLNLNGGSLAVSQFSVLAYNGQVFKWGNGTLVASNANIFAVATYAGSKSRSMTITGAPASFDTAGYAQAIPAFTGTGRLRLTGGGAVTFEESTLTYGLVLDGITLELGTLDSSVTPLTTTTLEALGSATLNVTLPDSPTGRYPLIACTSSFTGSLGHFTVVGGGAGRLVLDSNTLYLSFEETDDRLVYSDSAGGEDTPTGASYSRLVFEDGAGAFTVGGEGLTISQDIADSSAANQTVSAPITLSTENSPIYVEDGARLVLDGTLTATTPIKEGKGTLVLGSQPSFSNITVKEGTVDFGGFTYEGLITQNGERFYGQEVVLTNGTWYPNQNYQYNFFNLFGQTVTIADGFTANFTRNGVNSRIALGFAGVDGDESAFANLVIDGGTFKVHGDQSGCGNFIGVDHWGTYTLEVKRGTFLATGLASGGGTLRVAANDRPYQTGIVRVSGGLFMLEKDLTLATMYYGTVGGTSKGIYEQSGGEAVVSNCFYVGATSSTGGRSIVNLTGGVLGVGTLKCLAYNTQSVTADGATIKALVDDTSSAPFMTAATSADSYTKTYEIGEGGLTIDTDGHTVHSDLPWTGSGGLTVAGAGGALYLIKPLDITGNVVISDNATFAVTNSQTWTGTFTLCEGSKIRLDTSALTGDEIITLSTAGFTLPSGATDILDFVEVTDTDTYYATTADEGNSITLAFNASVPAYAYWIGAGSDPTDIADPANWACTNSAGGVVENAVPTTTTHIIINNGTTTFTLPQNASPEWAGLHFGNGNGTVTLAQDCDVYAAGAVTVAPGTTIDLNGHDLKVKSLTADDESQAVVTNSVAETTPVLYTDDAAGEAYFIDLDDITVCTNSLAVKIYGIALSTTLINVGANFDVDYIQTNGTVTSSTGFNLGNGVGTGRCSISGGNLTASVTSKKAYATIGGGTGTGILELSGDAVVQLPAIQMGMSATSCARLTISDSAQLALVHYNQGAWINIGHVAGSDCEVLQTGGTFSLGDDFNVGVNGATASYEMQGGTLTVGGSFVPGRAGGTGTFTQSGGTVNANSYLTIGYSGGNGACTMTGGALNSTTSNRSVQVGEQEGSVGLLDIAGGVARMQKIFVGASKATGTLRVRNGGRLVLTGAGIVADNGQSTVEFDGGIVETTAANATLMSDLTNVVFGTSGLTLTNNYAVGFTNCTFKVTPGTTAVPAIAMAGAGSLDLSNNTIDLTGTPYGAFVFATADDGTISGTPTVTIGGAASKSWKTTVSDDGKSCTVTSLGFILMVR